MNPSSRLFLSDLLAAGRTSNLPTVWSNLLFGLLVAVFESGRSQGISTWQMSLTLFCGSFLYLSGCLFNDYFDRHWDQIHKPNRPIALGRLSAPVVLFISISTALFALTAAFALGVAPFLTALFTLVCIIWYTIIHKRTAWGIVPMGLCRASLYVLGYMAVAQEGQMTRPLLGWSALGLLSYIAGLTLLARHEAREGEQVPLLASTVGLIFLALPFFTHLCPTFLLLELSFGFGVFCSLPFLFWITRARRTLKRGSIGLFVSQSLAGICLVDFLFLGPLGLFYLQHSTHSISLALLSLLFPLVCFAFALLLQKWTPAT